ncbi:MAG: thioredoxin family protein [Desulfobacteraceae bacterium]|jgi:FKBP-type peptidyl-prolyl cis-trans isomerase 2/glutaredoxin
MKLNMKHGIRPWLGGALVVFLVGVALFTIFSGKMAQADKKKPDMKNPDSAQADFNMSLDQAFTTAKEKGLSEVNVFPDEKKDVIQLGDMVEVDYSLRAEDGTLLRTTRAADAATRGKDGKPSLEASEIRGEIHRPETFLVGGGTNAADITGNILGMKVGDKKHLVLTPEKGGFPRDKEKISRFGRYKRIPMRTDMPVSDFKKQYGNDPEKGGQIMLAPYVSAVIEAVKDGRAKMVVEYSGDREERDSLGLTKIRKEKDDLVLELIPDKGAVFELNSAKGIVTSFDKTHFTVDFNPKGAGQNLKMDLNIVSLVKGSKLHGLTIDWITDYNQGLKKMATSGKPMVLFLYKKDCPWCEKMEKEIFPDTRAQSLGPDFVWVKIDSSKNTAIKEMYKQEGYPMIVLLNKDKGAYRNLKGFRDAAKFRKEIFMWLDDLKAGKTTFEPDNDDAEKNALKTDDCLETEECSE